ncbi:WD repeat-containing [Lecanosticta acicola]|uniref:WD repeat-containing n=1 Tax=Lecanosticta acicola TaxID=111012 RepID=A0AAI8Z6L5_9PEZI|nr:WD repeat-containing [Lecanosticta acicola]
MQHETHRVPVTALAFWSPDVILSGEGPLLKAYRVSSKALLATVPIFPSQTIHGVIVNRHGNASAVLVWGGRSVRQLSIGLADDTILRLTAGEAAEADDWILDASFSEHSDALRPQVALVTAHNALVLATLNEALESRLELVTTGSNCILYCAQVVWLSASKCLIASGTAFGDILIWSCFLSAHDGYHSASCQTHYTFSAHAGSVFGVQISPSSSGAGCAGVRRLLASCSDDRTVSIWDISDLTVESATLAEDQRQTGFGAKAGEDAHPPPLLGKVMGHLSRIWHILFLADPKKSSAVSTTAQCPVDKCLVSCGEDASSITWGLGSRYDSGNRLTYTLEQLESQKAHAGKNIWSVVFDGTCQVVTGGADGSIAIRATNSANSNLLRSEITLRDTERADNVRSYGFVDDLGLLATTDKGRALIIDIGFHGEHTIKEVSPPISGLCGYSVVASIPHLAFAAGSDGAVYAYSKIFNTFSNIVETGRKVAGIFAQDVNATGEHIGLLVTNMGTNSALFGLLACTCSSGRPLLQTQYRLRLPQGFTVTSFVHVQHKKHNLVLLGSRHGAIAIFVLPELEQEEPISCNALHLAVHGKETVTCLQHELAPPSMDIAVFSTGRDGTYAAHRLTISDEDIHLTTIHQLTLPFGPNVEGLGRPYQGGLWIWGFRGKQFVVYDIDAQQEVMAVECGGAHRNWSFQIAKEGGIFVWTKASKLYYARQAQLPFQTINSGGHGREIKSAAVSPRDSALIATGAEDTDIKLSRYEDGSFRCLHTLQKHNTGIQHLAWSGNGEYLFSSGGFEEFFVWRIRDDLPTPMMNIGVRCESAHPRSGTSDLRIMNFDVQPHGSDAGEFRITMVYSDSTIRTWKYISDDKAWQFLAGGSYLTSCLTQCLQLAAPHNDNFLLTAASDGHLTTWKVDTQQEEGMCWTSRHRVHQSGILSLVRSAAALHDGSVLIFTGGDDNAIGITRMSASGAFQGTLLVPRAHAAAVTALVVVAVAVAADDEDSRTASSSSSDGGVLLVSASLDQRVKVWRIRIDLDKAASGVDGLDVQLVQNSFTAVADVSSMESMWDPKGGVRKVLVCGVGMDVWKM